MSRHFRDPPLPPIPWSHAPVTPLPEVIESNSDAAWELFDAAQRARDPAPGQRRDHAGGVPGLRPIDQPNEGTK